MFDVATFDGSGNQDAAGRGPDLRRRHVFMYKDGDDRFVALDGISFSIS